MNYKSFMLNKYYIPNKDIPKYFKAKEKNKLLNTNIKDFEKYINNYAYHKIECIENLPKKINVLKNELKTIKKMNDIIKLEERFIKNTIKNENYEDEYLKRILNLEKLLLEHIIEIISSLFETNFDDKKFFYENLEELKNLKYCFSRIYDNLENQMQIIGIPEKYSGNNDIENLKTNINKIKKTYENLCKNFEIWQIKCNYDKIIECYKIFYKTQDNRRVLIKQQDKYYKNQIPLEEFLYFYNQNKENLEKYQIVEKNNYINNLIKKTYNFSEQYNKLEKINKEINKNPYVGKLELLKFKTFYKMLCTLTDNKIMENDDFKIVKQKLDSIFFNSLQTISIFNYLINNEDKEYIKKLLNLSKNLNNICYNKNKEIVIKNIYEKISYITEKINKKKNSENIKELTDFYKYLENIYHNENEKQEIEDLYTKLTELTNIIEEKNKNKNPENIKKLTNFYENLEDIYNNKNKKPNVKDFYIKLKDAIEKINKKINLGNLKELVNFHKNLKDIYSNKNKKPNVENLYKDFTEIVEKINKNKNPENIEGLEGFYLYLEDIYNNKNEKTKLENLYKKLNYTIEEIKKDKNSNNIKILKDLYAYLETFYKNNKNKENQIKNLYANFTNIVEKLNKDKNSKDTEELKNFYEYLEDINTNENKEQNIEDLYKTSTNMINEINKKINLENIEKLINFYEYLKDICSENKNKKQNNKNLNIKLNDIIKEINKNKDLKNIKELTDFYKNLEDIYNNKNNEQNIRDLYIKLTNIIDEINKKINLENIEKLINFYEYLKDIFSRNKNKEQKIDVLYKKSNKIIEEINKKINLENIEELTNFRKILKDIYIKNKNTYKKIYKELSDIIEKIHENLYSQKQNIISSNEYVEIDNLEELQEYIKNISYFEDYYFEKESLENLYIKFNNFTQNIIQNICVDIITGNLVEKYNKNDLNDSFHIFYVEELDKYVYILPYNTFIFVTPKELEHTPFKIVKGRLFIQNKDGTYLGRSKEGSKIYESIEQYFNQYEEIESYTEFSDINKEIKIYKSLDNYFKEICTLLSFDYDDNKQIPIIKKIKREIKLFKYFREIFGKKYLENFKKNEREEHFLIVKSVPNIQKTIEHIEQIQKKFIDNRLPLDEEEFYNMIKTNLSNNIKNILLIFKDKLKDDSLEDYDEKYLKELRKCFNFIGSIIADEKIKDSKTNTLYKELVKKIPTNNLYILNSKAFPFYSKEKIYLTKTNEPIYENNFSSINGRYLFISPNRNLIYLDKNESKNLKIVKGVIFSKNNDGTYKGRSENGITSYKNIDDYFNKYKEEIDDGTIKVYENLENYFNGTCKLFLNTYDFKKDKYIICKNIFEFYKIKNKDEEKTKNFQNILYECKNYGKDLKDNEIEYILKTFLPELKNFINIIQKNKNKFTKIEKIIPNEEQNYRNTLIELANLIQNKLIKNLEESLKKYDHINLNRNNIIFKTKKNKKPVEEIFHNYKLKTFKNSENLKNEFSKIHEIATNINECNTLLNKLHSKKINTEKENTIVKIHKKLNNIKHLENILEKAFTKYQNINEEYLNSKEILKIEKLKLTKKLCELQSLDFISKKLELLDKKNLSEYDYNNKYIDYLNLDNLFKNPYDLTNLNNNLNEKKNHVNKLIIIPVKEKYLLVLPNKTFIYLNKIEYENQNKFIIKNNVLFLKNDDNTYTGKSKNGKTSYKNIDDYFNKYKKENDEDKIKLYENLEDYFKESYKSFNNTQDYLDYEKNSLKNETEFKIYSNKSEKHTNNNENLKEIEKFKYESKENINSTKILNIPKTNIEYQKTTKKLINEILNIKNTIFYCYNILYEYFNKDKNYFFDIQEKYKILNELFEKLSTLFKEYKTNTTYSNIIETIKTTKDRLKEFEENKNFNKYVKNEINNLNEKLDTLSEDYIINSETHIIQFNLFLNNLKEQNNSNNEKNEQCSKILNNRFLYTIETVTDAKQSSDKLKEKEYLQAIENQEIFSKKLKNFNKIFIEPLIELHNIINKFKNIEQNNTYIKKINLLKEKIFGLKEEMEDNIIKIIDIILDILKQSYSNNEDGYVFTINSEFSLTLKEYLEKINELIYKNIQEQKSNKNIIFNDNKNINRNEVVKKIAKRPNEDIANTIDVLNKRLNNFSINYVKNIPSFLRKLKETKTLKGKLKYIKEKFINPLEELNEINNTYIDEIKNNNIYMHEIKLFEENFSLIKEKLEQNTNEVLKDISHYFKNPVNEIYILENKMSIINLQQKLKKDKKNMLRDILDDMSEHFKEINTEKIKNKEDIKDYLIKYMEEIYDITDNDKNQNKEEIIKNIENDIDISIDNIESKTTLEEYLTTYLTNYLKRCFEEIYIKELNQIYKAKNYKKRNIEEIIENIKNIIWENINTKDIEEIIEIIKKTKNINIKNIDTKDIERIVERVKDMEEMIENKIKSIINILKTTLNLKNCLTEYLTQIYKITNIKSIQNEKNIANTIKNKVNLFVKNISSIENDQYDEKIKKLMNKLYEDLYSKEYKKRNSETKYKISPAEKFDNFKTIYEKFLSKEDIENFDFAYNKLSEINEKFKKMNNFTKNNNIEKEGYKEFDEEEIFYYSYEEFDENEIFYYLEDILDLKERLKPIKKFFEDLDDYYNYSEKKLLITPYFRIKNNLFRNFGKNTNGFGYLYSEMQKNIEFYTYYLITRYNLIKINDYIKDCINKTNNRPLLESLEFLDKNCFNLINDILIFIKYFDKYSYDYNTSYDYDELEKYKFNKKSANILTYILKQNLIECFKITKEKYDEILKNFSGNFTSKYISKIEEMLQLEMFNINIKPPKNEFEEIESKYENDDEFKKLIAEYENNKQELNDK